MLIELSIQNFALIEQLQVRFGAGFNVLTGETGAGKSIVIDAIGAVLGERVSLDEIRSGSTKATIEASFDVSACPARLHELREAGILDEEETQLSVARELSTAGKAQVRVCGRLAPVSLLRSVGRNLVDLHGQHEHQSLLDPNQHVLLLDDWSSASELRQQCAALDQSWRAARRELDELKRDDREKAQRLDLLRFQAAEIDAADLSPGEEERLQNERSRLSHRERLIEQIGSARQLLSGGDETGRSAVDMTAAALRFLQDASRDDQALAPISHAVESAYFTLDESVRDLATYHEGLESDPQRLEFVADRLDLLLGLRRKYGDTLLDVIEHRAAVEQEMQKISGSEERIHRVQLDLEQLETELTETAAELTRLRREGAIRLEACIGAELSQLALSGARFEVDIQATEPGPYGADRVELLFSANAGEPPRPLSRVASGGEMSRIMLALKSLQASSTGIPTMIFDEIDSGIGGRTGEAIADRLHSLGSCAQVICVTHLPQIAAMADHHFHLCKTVEKGRTTVQLHELEGQERVEEISRMLGGSRQSAARHAQDLLRRRAGRRRDVVGDAA